MSNPLDWPLWTVIAAGLLCSLCGTVLSVIALVLAVAR